MKTRHPIVLLMLMPMVLTACDDRGPAAPTARTQPSPATPPSRPINQEAFEVTGVVTDERGMPLAGAVVTLGLWLGGVVQWPSVQTDASGSYRASFTASPMPNGFVARAQVVADGYEEYWRSLLRNAGTTTFVENFRLGRIMQIVAGDSVVLSVPPDTGECRGWVAEVCPIVRVTVPAPGNLTIEAIATDAGAAAPPVEVCCVDGNERYGNPIAVPVAPGPDLEVKVGLRRGFSTTQTFLVKTAFEKFEPLNSFDQTK